MGRVKDGEAGAGINPCWSCNGPVSVRAPFCHTCGAIQPPRSLDHFARLNLPVDFDLKTSDLERQYFGLQRYFHPDRFAAKSAREKALSLQQSTSLNEAYETLKRPLSRAEYLLDLKGRQADGRGCHTISDEKLLVEAMEMREQLADADSAAEIDSLIKMVDGEIEQAFATVKTAFATDDLDSAARAIVRLRYLSKLLEEARGQRARVGA